MKKQFFLSLIVAAFLWNNPIKAKTIFNFRNFPQSNMPCYSTEGTIHFTENYVSAPVINDTTFQSFLNKFLDETFWGKNFDSLVWTSSPIIKKYTNPSLGFGRFFNPGISCKLFIGGDFGYFESPGNVQPENTGLNFISNELVVLDDDGLEAISPEGIYYKQVAKLPSDWNEQKGVSLPVPAKFSPLKKMQVGIVKENSLLKTFYFVEFNGKWYLLYMYDCGA